MFTQRELIAMVEEYSNTSKARQDYLSMMWEIAKEEYLHDVRNTSRV